MACVSFVYRLLFIENVMFLRHLKCAVVTFMNGAPFVVRGSCPDGTLKEFIFKKLRKSNYFLLTYMQRNIMDNSKILDCNPNSIRGRLKIPKLRQKVRDSEDKDTETINGARG